jgi:hypothetical protein
LIAHFNDTEQIASEAISRLDKAPGTGRRKSARAE